MKNFLHNLDDSYDVIVCGAGPAGLVSAHNLIWAGNSAIKSGKGLKVALLDRRDPWREPVACAEAVSRRGLHSLVPVEKDWIRSVVDGVDFVAPDGTLVRYEQKKSGYIIDRARMHARLAERCAERGAHCHFRAAVKNISLPDAEGLRTVTVSVDGQQIDLKARAVIDCTGAGDSLGTDEGLRNGKIDLETAVFAILKGIPHARNFIRMYYGQEFFPGGYGWVFPRTADTANVGLVIAKEFNAAKSARKRMLEWVAKEWPGVTIERMHGGPIACGEETLLLGHAGLFKAGDSASMVNPLSRAGILEAMKAGRAVSVAVLKYLQNPAQSSSIIEDYEETWKGLHGAGHMRLARAKAAFTAIPDSLFNKAARKINKIPLKRRSLLRIFLATLTGSPRLLWQMRSLLR